MILLCFTYDYVRRAMHFMSQQSQNLIEYIYIYICYTGYEYIDSASLKSSVFILCEQRALF